jgi:hypothetical protein
MQNRDRVWWWLAAAVALILGFALVARRNHNGWFLVLLGAVYLGAMTGTARRLAASNPSLARWVLLGITLLLLLLAVIVGAVLRGW